MSAFTEQLDMAALGYKYAECKGTGCRPYDPCTMLNLYIYGYLHRVRSSRRLRDETRRNVEVMWLMEGLTPDDKTICNFRKDNTKPLKETFREFSRMCRRMGLYGGELIATDGTKFRANNALKNNHNETVVENELSRIDKKISEYMNMLEQGDKEEKGEEEPKAMEIRAALDRLKQRKAKFESLEARVKEEGEVSTVDADSRLMRCAGNSRQLSVCYNVQTAVDSKNKLIVDFDLTNCAND
jgi:transposase